MREIKRHRTKRIMGRTKRTIERPSRFNNSGALKGLKGAYKGFVILRVQKPSINSYVDRVKLHVKVLSKDQLKEVQSSEVIITVWVRWKKPVKLAISLGQYW